MQNEDLDFSEFKLQFQDRQNKSETNLTRNISITNLLSFSDGPSKENKDEENKK
eukprot:Awhi_evm1s9189